MTAQEKANELFVSFSRIENRLTYIDRKGCIKCAYLLTEEILSALYAEGIREQQGTRNFWYEVQAELDKL